MARREIQRNASDEVKVQLKGSRWVLVKNQKELNEKQRTKLENLYQASPELKVCHQLKKQSRAIFESTVARPQARLASLRWMKQVEKQSVMAL